VSYMSPEQARGLELDARTDIFSLGVVLYEMMAGQAPFQGLTRSDVLATLLKTEPFPLSDYLPEIPRELEQAVSKALCKGPEERYQTVVELRRDLRDLRHKLETGDWSSDSESKQPAAITTNQSEREALVDPKNVNRDLEAPAKVAQSQERRRGLLTSRRSLAISALAMLVVAALSYLLLFRGAPTGVSPGIKSLAVLPFRSLNQEAKEDYLGLGIATDIITKVSQSGELTVRPPSAVRKYLKNEMDALAAARELKVDAVLDSNYLQVGDQLRLSVNLLRVQDGTSLWAEKFDERFTGIFAIQDKVSQQVAQRLRLTLSPAQQARLTKRYTSNPEAYNYYVKAMYHSGNLRGALRTRSESNLTVDLFKKAIELDPNYALAHAQLGYVYAFAAAFQEDNPALIEQAKQEVDIAERLDPQLAEVHAARYFILFSKYGGWQVEAAFRELRLAQQLDPNVGHEELGNLYSHIGLEKQAVEELEIALKANPNNDPLKNFHVDWYFESARPDEGLEASKRFFNRGTDFRYYLEKRMV
ncbi:MAG TPA: protein kinase, partial [Terriglobia bacterium]|nr:protein kinase [Terriglobia bacterium]